MLQGIDDSEEITSVNTLSDLEKIITKKKKVTVLKHKYNNHYVYIKNLSALVGRQISKNTKKKYFCDICFHYLSTKEALVEHEEKCLSLNDCEIILPDPDNPEESTLEFKNFHHKLTAPFIIYSDFESVCKPVVGDGRREIKHEPVSVGYYFKCRY